VLDMRENELERRRIEAAKILAVLKEQENKLNNIIQSQHQNSEEINNLFTLDTLDIQQIEGHRDFGIKLTVDEANQERIIKNTKAILEKKQLEVQEAHKKVEILKKLKEKQEKQYYKEFLDSEIKEIDDITSARFKVE
jgi:flagellar export protein FliJ